jgi:hypothetical protein
MIVISECFIIDLSILGTFGLLASFAGLAAYLHRLRVAFRRGDPSGDLLGPSEGRHPYQEGRHLQEAYQHPPQGGHQAGHLRLPPTAGAFR